MKSTIHHTLTALVAAVAIAAVALSARTAQAVVIPVTNWADDIAGGNGTNDPLLSAGGFNARIAGGFTPTPITLGAVGDSISLTGSFELVGTVGNSPQGVFRTGLYNTNSSPGNDGWLGYLTQSDGQNSNAAAGGQLIRKAAPTTNYTTPGAGDTVLSTQEQLAQGLVANTPYDFALTVTLLPLGQTQVDWSLTDNDTYNYSATTVDTAPATLSFDRVGLFVASQIGGEAQFTDVNLNAVIVPEPGTLAMLGIGTVGLALVYRRRRRG